MVKCKNIIKELLTILLIFLPVLPAYCRKLTVGMNSGFKSVSEAAMNAKPGDSIIIKAGTYPGDEVIYGLKGKSDKWIVITAEIKGEAHFTGGSTALHFTDPEYVVIEGFTFSLQTSNGVNIDDGGTYESPAHHVLIRNCIWSDMAATGNNDELKLSGLDDFEIRNCRFLNGSTGGSMIDMVGCHNGIIEGNFFGSGGSNSIQAKGGSADLIISANRFENGGERAINIGGSTGMEFFRPAGAASEASGIKVWSNIFEGGTSAVAFVGSVNCEVVNNTIINPSKWVVRILQENRNTTLATCSQNIFANNIIVFPGHNMIAVNIGPGTNPETFTFSHNLWYNPDDPDWKGPELPVEEPGRIITLDPQFADKHYRLTGTSPAAGKDSSGRGPEFDFNKRRFAHPRSLGAVEYVP